VGEGAEQVERVLGELRPFLNADGGDVELVGIDRAAGCVRLRLRGACGGCPSATTTVQHGIKVRLQEALPWVRDVVAVD
jgi:Fe-S cluster biogenesis protein NfuA